MQTILRLWATLILSSALLRAAEVTVTVLATTDLHGNLLPVDYVTGDAVPRGLAKIATLIRAARAENPNTILIDCGDTIQGTPLEAVYQSALRAGLSLGAGAPAGAPAGGPSGDPIGYPIGHPIGHPTGDPIGHPTGDPMMRAMNLLGYDAMTVGNHEFNVGLPNLDRARRDANFPWISANTNSANTISANTISANTNSAKTALAKPGTERAFAPYIVKTVAGVKVAVIGVTTPLVPLWERPENLGAYRFTSPVEAVKLAIARLRREQRPDLIVVAAHAGLGRNPRTNTPEESAENFVYDLAMQVPDVDAIVFGHSHAQLEGMLAGNVLLVQPKNAGASLARIDFTFDPKLVSKKSHLIPVTAETAAAPDLMELAKPYEAATERYLNTPVATAARPLSAERGRVEDTAIVDAIQRVQLYYAKADVSFTALFNPRVRIPGGEVTVRQIAALYPYDNELFAIEGTGKMVKDALENAARYFSNKGMAGFNYDMAEGVEYEIERSRPEGDRIRNLSWHGKPLDPARKLRIAINNYRAGGTGGYGMFQGAKIIWRSGDDVRELVIRYYTERKVIPTEASNNWRLKE